MQYTQWELNRDGVLQSLNNKSFPNDDLNRPANQYIPPMAEPYQYIIFKASEVKDLSVDEQPITAAPRNVHDDPAVMVSEVTIPRISI